jgi:hypothetical protein
MRMRAITVMAAAMMVAPAWPQPAPAGGSGAGDARPTVAGSSATAPGSSAAARDAISDPALASFSAHYQAEWKSISVGTSDLELRPDAEPGHYMYTWTITAHGIFRVVYPDDLVQKSWFSIVGDHVRPAKYNAVDGSSSVDLDFDWNGGHVRGTSETKPVDLALKEGTQDVMSIQVEVMLDLKKGNLPGTFRIIDKDQLKDFLYTREGTASIRTALGQLDTIIVSSQRAGNNRILRMWFAPSLGFVPVQAERSRDGKLEFAMRIKSLKR